MIFKQAPFTRPVEGAVAVMFRPRIRKRLFYAIVFFASMTLLSILSLALWLVDRRLAVLPWTAAAVMMAYGVIVERFWLQWTRAEVRMRGLPADMDGFRIVHISDIHWDAYTRPGWLARVFEQVNATEPDLVVLTGDLVTHFRRFIGPCARALGTLRARHGVFAVLGNHDHWASGRLMTEALEREGIGVLSNGHVLMQGGLWLVGVDDPHLYRADLDKALSGIPDDGLPRLLLAHSPDIMHVAVGRVDLVLTGHTHGGQVRFPGLGPLMRVTRHAAGRRFVVGWGQSDGTACFTNRGLGSVLIPIRFNCRPEVATITLRA